MGGEKVAIIGGGGREAALLDKYLQSKHVESAIGIPGNDMMKIEKQKPVYTFPGIKTTDVKEIVGLCKSNGVSLVDVAQDNAVRAGLVDALQAAGIPVIGPTRLAGEIEWSKAFGRSFGNLHKLPQPEFVICKSIEEGMAYIKTRPDKPRFIKADGLYEGKGALPALSSAEAIEKINEVYKFKGGAGATYLIEDWMKNDDGTNGEEFSAFGLSDGRNVRMLGYAQDHKRANDFDMGNNTGGTGCSTPPLVLTDNIKADIEDIFDRVISGLAERGRVYKGVLYLGGILVQKNGKLDSYIVEWNARWGDPEAQCILPGIQNDIYEMSMAAINGDIKNLAIRNDGKARVAVAGMSRGYPDDYSAVKGKQIFGLEDAMRINGVRVYGAGVRFDNRGYYANGGRLFYVVGEGRDVIDAREKAYAALSHIFIDGNNLHYRKDIGWRDVQRLLHSS